MNQDHHKSTWKDWTWFFILAVCTVVDGYYVTIGLPSNPSAYDIVTQICCSLGAVFAPWLAIERGFTIHNACLIRSQRRQWVIEDEAKAMAEAEQRWLAGEVPDWR